MPTKVHLVNAMVFPVVMYGCESWTINKAERQKIDAFELRYWRRLLRVPWTTRRSNQAILKEISPDYSLEGLMLKLKLQYFGHLMRRADSFEETLMLGKNEGGRRRGWQRMRWLDGITNSRIWVWVRSGSWWWTERPGVHGVKKSHMTEQLNWILMLLSIFACNYFESVYLLLVSLSKSLPVKQLGRCLIEFGEFFICSGYKSFMSHVFCKILSHFVAWVDLSYKFIHLYFFLLLESYVRNCFSSQRPQNFSYFM